MKKSMLWAKNMLPLQIAILASVARLVAIPIFTSIGVMATADAAQLPRHVEGELLVKFADGSRGAAAERARQTMQHEVRRNFDFIGWQQIRLPRGVSVEEGLAKYRNLPGVLAVEPNYIAEGPDPIVDPVPLVSAETATGLTPNDPGFLEQWGLAKIHATNAWEVSTGDSNIVVAIIDSGINYDHEDLAAHMWRNPGEIPANGVDDDGNGYVDDVYGTDLADDFYGNDTDPRDQGIPVYHGTGCAGIIGALANNGLGIAGLNWNVQLMAVRTLGTNNFHTGATVLEAYGYVTLMKNRGVNIKVINMSYGSGPFAQSHSDALSQLAARGIVGVAAAGNSTNNNDVVPDYPSCYDVPGLVAVAATDENDNLRTFSNWGSTNVDLAAPSIVPTTGGPGTNVYTILRGTSSAAPHVAGAAALLFATYPDATPEEVKLALLETVDLIPALTNRVVSHGRLNVGRAIVHSDLNNGPPVIYRQPQNQIAVLGHSASLSVGVRARGPLFYGWRFGSNPGPTTTNSILVIDNVTFGHAGEYSVVVVNAHGSVVSQVATLTVTPLLISNHPQNQAVRLGSSASFSVTALSPQPPTYQWYFEGSPVSGATGSNLTVTNVQFAAEGFYTVVVSNSYTSVTSAPARLSVLIGPAQHAYIKASNPDVDDNFGFALAISGDTMVIGTPFEDSGAIGVNGDQNNNNSTNSGAAYVFVRDGDTWIQQAYLKASNTDGNDQFGNGVAISGDTIVVGAPFEDSGAIGVNGDQNNNSSTNSGA
ncbi:MAG: S8 family serine peptidase, partial [Verrucomicrobia subdivision 3 bacterium]|nr:S8 family serine peptidase [Limisphaerales bacterium]